MKKLRRFAKVPLMLAVSAAIDAHAFDDIYSDNEITFVTPANMTSSHRDTPNSITALNVEDLQYLGIDSFVDAMRLVPGMVVAETHGSNATIGYHGTSVHVPRRTQILYNSNRLYRSGYADILWQRMPIEVSDLERIEVVRGTNITDYGTNAFTSTVNMIQKPVALEPGVTVYGKSSTNDEHKASAAVTGQLGASKGYLRFASINAEGFDESPQIKSMDDDYQGRSVLYNGELELSNSVLLDWHIANSKYEYAFPQYDNLRSESEEVQTSVGGFSPDGPTREDTITGTIKLSGSAEKDSVNTGWKVGADVTQFDRKQDLIFCFPPIFTDRNLELLDSADNIHIDLADFNLLVGSSLMTGVGALNKSILSPIDANQQQLLVNLGQAVRSAGLAAVTSNLCGHTNQDLTENRYSLFGGFQRSSDRSTFSSDLSLREDDAESETYLAGSHSRTSYEWSNNFRYRTTESLVLNFGVMAESNSDINDIYFSPRASLNFAIDNQNIVRVLAAESNRLPGIHETERRWQYPLRYMGGAKDYYGRTEAKGFRVASTSDLEPEKLEVYELGYTFMTDSSDTVIDMKYFNETYSDLISEPFSYLAFELTNAGEAKVEGFEVDLSHKVGMLKLGGGMAYIDNETPTLEERSLHSTLSGNVWMILQMTDRTHLGVVYFGSENEAQNSYDRIDVNLNYTLPVGRTEVSFDLNYKRMPHDQANYTEYSSSDPFLFGYNDRDIFSLKAELTF